MRERPIKCRSSSLIDVYYTIRSSTIPVVVNRKRSCLLCKGRAWLTDDVSRIAIRAHVHETVRSEPAAVTCQWVDGATISLTCGSPSAPDEAGETRATRFPSSKIVTRLTRVLGDAANSGAVSCRCVTVTIQLRLTLCNIDWNKCTSLANWKHCIIVQV